MRIKAKPSKNIQKFSATTRSGIFGEFKISLRTRLFDQAGKGGMRRIGMIRPEAYDS